MSTELGNQRLGDRGWNRTSVYRLRRAARVCYATRSNVDVPAGFFVQLRGAPRIPICRLAMGTMVDLRRFELRSSPCEGDVFPLDDRPEKTFCSLPGSRTAGDNET